VSRRLSVFAFIGLLIVASSFACAGSPESDPSRFTPTIRLVQTDGRPPTINVEGLPKPVLDALSDARLSPAQWSALLRVEVDDHETSSGEGAPALPAVAGEHVATGSAIVFTPMFGLDPGLRYRVTFDPARLPSSPYASAPSVVTTVGLPKIDLPSTTVVDRIYPSGETVPENLLRLYVQFSAPMGRKGGLEFIKLLDDRGEAVKDPFLPLDTEFWNGDRTRFTLFLDPGRVKRGLLPNKEVGRSLDLNAKYTLVVSREWPDAQGVPLKADYRRSLRAGPAIERPLDPPARWRLGLPASGSTEPLIVTFAQPLDHGLLMRALGVETAQGAPLAGSSRVEAEETRWLFAPAKPWRAGDYRLVVLRILEDASGNQIGRAFEVDNFQTIDQSPQPERITVGFSVR
jgi:hypothetical protein